MNAQIASNTPRLLATSALRGDALITMLLLHIASSFVSATLEEAPGYASCKPSGIILAQALKGPKRQGGTSVEGIKVLFDSVRKAFSSAKLNRFVKNKGIVSIKIEAEKKDFSNVRI